MVVGGSREETLDPGSVLLGTRQQDVPEGTGAPWRIRSRVTQLHNKHWYNVAPNTYAPHKSLDLCVGCVTARAPRPKQVCFLEGHSPNLWPKGLIHKAVEKRQEMKFDGSRILEPICIIDLDSGFSNSRWMPRIRQAS
ncbi:unnamed protein product [Schistosoma curassoni]|uniref:Uncharacterized protein n=1 Tax=Schistosoma curassoni TaxID=6186 RepID=A0A183JYF5_9TREM|nr:unnamed protein product [Schistosoma curassoni]